MLRDDATLNCKVTGNGDTTLLFVHGSYIDQSYWQEQVTYFSDRYKVVTMDLAGHGLSGRNRLHWSIQGLAEDIQFLIEELKLSDVVLIGHSLGAELSLMVATKIPQRIKGLIAVDFFKNAGTPMTPEFQKKAQEILQQLEENFEATNEQYVNMVLVTPQTPGEIKARVIKDYRNAWEPMGKATMPELFNISNKEAALLRSLTIKLFLINVDYMPTNEEPLKQLPGAGYHLQQIHGTSHFPMLENPDALNQAIQNCLAEIVSNR